MSFNDMLSTDRAALIERAAMWLIEQPPTQRPIPVMKEQFQGLTTSEACAAIGKANAIRAGGKDVIPK